MANEFIIKRIAETKDGTFGVLLDNGQPIALTCENQWFDNEINKSCIPLGSYVCQRVESPRFGETFEVIAVPNRSHILFHKGNTEDDTRGCILLGEQFGFLGGKLAILHSGSGFKEFMQRLKGHNIFTLAIRRA